MRCHSGQALQLQSSGGMLQSQRQMAAESVIDKSIFMLVIHEDDITLCFSVHRVYVL